jgi:hypothetical protein
MSDQVTQDKKRKTVAVRNTGNTILSPNLKSHHKKFHRLRVAKPA